MVCHSCQLESYIQRFLEILVQSDKIITLIPSLSFFLSSSYPLLRLPLPGTGPVEFTTGVRDYSVPSHEPHGDLGERPDWVDESMIAVLF